MKTQLPYLTHKQRVSILILIILIVILQGIIFWVKYANTKQTKFTYAVDKTTQNKIDSLKQLALKKYEPQPFNPNFITDAKGFQLGMTTAEIDRFLAFRKTGKYVNSAADFQKVTGVSNEVLTKITPLFKFPEWTQTTKNNVTPYPQQVVSKKIDLNQATFQDLIAIKGIGEYYANAIINEREKLNGFVSIQQIQFIKGLRPEAVNAVKAHAFVKASSTIIKVNANTASKEQLAQIPYITPYIAREIVILRSKQDAPLEIRDLEKINNFPLDKLEIIRLYLDF